MYALVDINSKQFKVCEGDEILVDLQHKEKDSLVDFDKVMALVDGDKATFGTPYLSSCKVQGKVLEEEKKAKKVKVYKYHRRKGYRKTQGHRQAFTLVKIEKIVTS